MEEHYDDCGEDFSAIETSLSHYGSAPAEDERTEMDSEEDFSLCTLNAELNNMHFWDQI